MALDTAHTFKFSIKPVGGAFTDYWAYVRSGSVNVTDVEGAETDTLSIELEDYDKTLSITEWSECYLQVDGAGYLFYGYITKIKPTAAANGDHLIYTLKCESSIVLLKLSGTVKGTWLGLTIKQLVAAAFSAAGVTGWDITTYVDAGPTLTSFTATGEQLPAVLDRLVKLASDKAATPWGWRVEQNLTLRLGASSGNAAPFSIATLAAANWTTTFPVSGEPDVELDASTIINRVTVKGGSHVSATATETFNGDGVTTLFATAHMPIKDIVRITVGGTLQSHGVDWYDTFGGGYNVLVNYAAGTLRWPDVSPPAVGTNNISVTYRYSDTTTLSVTVTDAASYAKYGIYFDATVEDSSLTTEAEATSAADAILNEYATGVIQGTLTVERYGLRAGQYLTIVLPLFSLNGAYVIRRVTTEIDAAGTGVKSTARFGGRASTLSGAVGSGGTVSQGAYSDVVQSQAEGEVGVIRVNERIEFIDPLTTYTEP